MPSPFLIQNDDIYDYTQIVPREVPNPELTIPDDSYTIGELFNRYQAGTDIGQVRHGIEDNDINNPLRYDNDLDSATTFNEITYNTFNDSVQDPDVSSDT